jgi:TRAP-type mannitol/chloroaromatic compound transport system permease small subunit
MLKSFFKLIDGISWLTSKLANISVIILVASMIYEVLARYIFNAPTQWSYDLAYMGSSALFILGISWTLRQKSHIRIDVFRKMLSVSVANKIEGLIYLLILFPLFSMLFKTASSRTIKAWLTNEVEMVSPWAPLMWPLYMIIAIGLGSFALQLLVEGLRTLILSNEANPREQQ